MAFHEEMQSADNQTSNDFARTDALVLLDKLEEQEQIREQEFFRLTEQIQKLDTEGIEIGIESELPMLPELLKTKRERAIYNALMKIIRAERERLIEYQKHMYAQAQELKVLRQAFQTIFDEDTFNEVIFDAVPKVRFSNERFIRKALHVTLQQLHA